MTARKLKVEPAKIVLEGPPNSGKSTLIEMIKALGYPTVLEVPQELIEEGYSWPNDPDAFDRERWYRQIKYEKQIPRDAKVAFLDRAKFSSPGYRVEAGLKVPRYMYKGPLPCYSLMFLLEPCPWKENGIRFEGKDGVEKAVAYQWRIIPFIEEQYKQRGVPVIRVPLMPAPERLEMILQESKRLLPWRFK